MFIPKGNGGYDYKDEFYTPLTTGNVDGTDCEEGPGTRHVVDTDSKLTISGGKLNMVPHSTPATGDPGFWIDEAVTRAAGVMLKVQLKVFAVADRIFLGFDNNKSTTMLNGLALNLGKIRLHDSDTLLAEVFSLLNDIDYEFIYILKTAGGALFIKDSGTWKFLGNWGSNATATLYAGIINKDAAFTSEYLRIPSERWLPIPLVSDGFNRAAAALGISDGEGILELSGLGHGGSGKIWTGATYTIPSESINITPTEGGELWDGPAAVFTSQNVTIDNVAGYNIGANSMIVDPLPLALSVGTKLTFAGGGEYIITTAAAASATTILSISGLTDANVGDGVAAPSGTYAWEADGDNTIASVGNALEITYVDGYWAAKVNFRDSDDLSSDLTIGQWYAWHVDSKINAGVYSLQLNNGAASINKAGLTNTTFETNNFSFCARHATDCYIRPGAMGGVEVVTLDNLSLKPLTLSSLFSNTFISHQDVTLEADLTLTTGTQAGIVVNLDSISSPANFIIGYHDGTRAILEKCVAGVYTTLISEAAAYGAGDTIEIVKSGTSYILNYDGSQIGATQTVEDAGIIDNTLHGAFSTFSTNTVVMSENKAKNTPTEGAELWDADAAVFTSADVTIDNGGGYLTTTTSMTVDPLPYKLPVGTKLTFASGGEYIITTTADAGATTILSSSGLTVAAVADGEAAPSGTYSWWPYPNNTLANVSNKLVVTYVSDDNGATSILSDSNDLSSDLTVWQWYVLAVNIKVGVGDAVTIRHDPSVAGKVDTDKEITNTTFQTHSICFMASSAGSDIFRVTSMGTGEVVTLDNLSLKPLALSSLFASVVLSTPDVVATVEATIVAGTQAGLVLNLDDAANPANFLIFYHNGTNAILEKCVAGTYTTLVSEAATYAAGAEIRAIKDDTEVRLYYNDALIGSVQTVSDAGIKDNVLHGLFSTYDGNRLDNYNVYHRGTDNYYAYLDRF